MVHNDAHQKAAERRELVESVALSLGRRSRHGRVDRLGVGGRRPVECADVDGQPGREDESLREERDGRRGGRLERLEATVDR